MMKRKEPPNGGLENPAVVLKVGVVGHTSESGRFE